MQNANERITQRVADEEAKIRLWTDNNALLLQYVLGQHMYVTVRPSV